MFFHNFKYTFKVLIKNKALVFWTIFWPIILGTMFYLAFSNITNSSKLNAINLGVVDNNEYKANETLSETLSTLSNKENPDYLFDIKYGNLDEIDELLENKKIEGYIYINNNNTLVIVKSNGIDQTIIKYVVDEVKEYEKLASSIIEYNITNSYKNSINVDTIYNNVILKINSNSEYINDISNKNMEYMMIEFYTLIAMTCLFGAMLTCTVISNYLANINKKGARVTLAPVSRMTLLLGGLLASFVIQIITISLLLFYTKEILNINYGPNFRLVVLLSLIGSLAGNSLGLAVGSIAFKNSNSQNGIILSVTMLGCFFAGMMGVSMKYVIDTNIPFINVINPANMITDGFYALYYYSTLTRYYKDIISLLIFSITLLIISYFLMRRKKYDSI